MEKTPAQLPILQRALDIRQKLIEAYPTVTEFQRLKAMVLGNIGEVMRETGKATEAFAAYDEARATMQKLVDANPDVPRFRVELRRN